MNDFQAVLFDVTKKISAADAANIDYSGHLGEVHGDDEGKLYKLVKFETGGTTFTSPQDKIFKWHDRSTYEVEPVDGNTDRVLGVSPCTEADLDADDLFYVQIAGPCYVYSGDDTANDVTIGEYVRPDNDLDLGKAGSNGSTYDEGVTFAIAREGAGGIDNVRCLVDILGVLVG